MKQKGFSLLEAMIIIAVVGILAAIFIPAFLSMRERQAAIESGEAVEQTEEVTEQEFNWEADGELYCSGIVVNQNFDSRMTDEHVIIYLDDEMIQQECFLDSQRWGSTNNYFPDGRLLPDDHFRVTRYDEYHYKVEKLSKETPNSEDESTEPETPDRGKQ